MDTKDLKAFIRSGGYAWPGGYPTMLLMADGEYICAEAAHERYRQVLWALRHPDGADRDWTPIAVEAHWEGEPIICAHSGRAIESAYGVPG
jgi:hypothetical protein